VATINNTRHIVPTRPTLHRAIFLISRTENEGAKNSDEGNWSTAAGGPEHDTGKWFPRML